MPASAEKLAWLTGFTGSAGMAVVLPDKAAAFTDGRYALQLASQTNPDLWERKHITEEPPPSWLSVNAAAGAKIGYDPLLISEEGLTRYIDAGLDMMAVDRNPIDAVWTDRPMPSLAPAVPHPLEHAGRSAEEKREQIAALLREAKHDSAVISDPASIAWLLNIRGSDVPFTPFALGFALLHANGGTELFMDPGKLPEATRAWLGNTRFRSRTRGPGTGPGKARGEASPGGYRRHPDLVRTNAPQRGGYRGGRSRSLPVTEGMQERNRAAGCPQCSSAGCRGGLPVPAISCREQVRLAARLKCRRRRVCWRYGNRLRAFVARVFPRSRARASTVPLSTTALQRTATGRSGRTRFTSLIPAHNTWTARPTSPAHFGPGPSVPPQALREQVTRVLKGHIAIATLVFPRGVGGAHLDAFARRALWQVGLDYDHGTGHGVGSYLSVHEGPVSLSRLARPVPIEAGMILSNEPGYYLPGAHGIRLENLLLVQAAELPSANKPFLKFETLTLAPFDRQLIDPKMLDASELAWLNAYQKRVMLEVEQHLDVKARDWLAAACREIT